MNMRRIIERLFRNFVIKRSIVAGNCRYRLVVSPDSQLKYLKIGKQAFDYDLISIAEKYLRKGDNAWDIGANVGVFSAAATICCNGGRVVALEPDPFLAGLLRRTNKINTKKFCVVQAAVSGKCGLAEFNISSRGRARNSLA